jgi:CDP-glucose 4,6-dehydratase
VELSGRRVLVTGHNGFKGSWLALWLGELGANVTGFSAPLGNRPSLYETARVGELVDATEGDLRDPVAVARCVSAARPEVILHLAAQPIVRRSYVAPGETYAINVMGTVNVLEAARACDSVGAVVVVTSDKCYLNRGLDQAFREDDPLGGADPYSASKAAQEIVATSYRQSFDMPIATARAGNVIAGGDWGEDRLVPDAMQAALNRTPVEVRNPAATRPWQHVLNPLHGYLMLAERLLAGEAAEAWNFGPPDSDARPVGWIIERLRELWPGGIEVTGATELNAPAEASTLRLDSTKSREQLGWEPRLGLEDGLRAIVDWHVALRDGADMRAVTLDQIRAY